MKLLKKTIALLATVSMLVSSIVTASAAFSTISVSNAKTVNVGDVITLEATFDTLVNAKGMEIEFVYDKTAFTADTTDNEDYNFGTNKKPVYYPNYISEDLLSNYMDEMSILNAWAMLSNNVTTNGIKLLSTDTEGGYVIESGDEAEDMYPYKTVGINLTAAKAGTYTITVTAIVSDATAGDIISTKTIAVTVAGGETSDFENVDEENQTVKDETTQEAKKYDGKYLKHISTVLTEAALSKRISIKCGDEERVSDRTIAETLGGIGVTGSSVTGTIAIGVLTSDINAVFTFDLVD